LALLTQRFGRRAGDMKVTILLSGPDLFIVLRWFLLVYSKSHD